MCSRCHTEKPLEEFNRWTRGRDGRQPYCRSCTSSYYQANSIKHKATVAARNRRVAEEINRLVYEYLLEHPCVECGESAPVVLDFDHVRGVKVGNVCDLMRRGRWSAVEAEIAKCEVRCANCHRRKTARELGYYRHGALVKSGITPSF